MADTGAAGAIAKLRSAIFADASLQADLGGVAQVAAFVARLVAVAKVHDLHLDPKYLGRRLQPDPLGLSPGAAAPDLEDPAPMKGWLPVEVHQGAGGPSIEWAYFGQRPLTEPFYQDAVRSALGTPFNRLFRLRTPLDVLPRWAAAVGDVAPNGFIFHMSRCGSTLAAQMLAASPATIVLSEAAPIDALVQLDRSAGPMPPDQRRALLRAMVGVFGQVRRGEERRYVVKLDSWHALALPLFQAAFPGTPWVFLYRDPVEVLVSQMRQRGMQTVPAFVPPSVYGLAADSGAPAEKYCAQVLGAIGKAVPATYARGGGLLINYAELPEAVWRRILPHFHIPGSDEGRRRMADAARRDAKAPGLDFAPDVADKQAAATGAIRAACSAYMADIHADLERLRQGQERASDRAPPLGDAPARSLLS